ncbi:MAG: hypothetical protein ABJ004_10640 [Cyclobacteriaceae bacterium]
MKHMSFLQAVLRDLFDNLRGSKYRKREGKPYMRRREMIIFEELICNLQPKRILEWGAGYSTLYFPEFLTEDFSWLSIESDEKWISHLRELNKNPKVEIELVPQTLDGDFHTDNDGTYEEFRDYVNFPQQKGTFDYIVIDGRARSACLKKAYDLISEEGVVVMHDANRKYYREHFNLFENKFLITDNRKRSGGMAILSKGKSIQTLVRTDYHERKWTLVRNPIARFLMV